MTQHEPELIDVTTIAGDPEFVPGRCKTCRHPWPCPDATLPPLSPPSTRHPRTSRPPTPDDCNHYLDPPVYGENLTEGVEVTAGCRLCTATATVVIAWTSFVDTRPEV